MKELFMELDPYRHSIRFVSGRGSYVWTEDEGAGLPGSPEVADFHEPMPRKQIPKEFVQTQPAILTVGSTTIFMLVVTFYDWGNSLVSFSAGSQKVFEHGQYESLFLSMFSHGDLVHLLSNLLGFAGFGYLLKRHFGSLAFPVVPLLVGLLTTVLSIVNMPENHSTLHSKKSIVKVKLMKL